MRDCWELEPEKRPSFRELSEDLNKQLETIDRESYLDMNTDVDNDSKQINLLAIVPLILNELIKTKHFI